MKVNKQDLHPDLQSFYWPTRIFTFLLGFSPMVKLVDKLSMGSTRGKDVEGLDCGTEEVPSPDGETQIRTRIYRPENQQGKLPLFLYIHGGGYIMGAPEMTGDLYKQFIAKRPCVIVAPDYRKAWTKPFPAGLDDCYDCLLWAIENAAELNIDPSKIIVGGHSAGGGLTAAVTLRARNQGDVKISFQMPIYPMIDDTQPDDAARAIETPVWNTTTNRKGWGAYLSELNKQGAEIPAEAAPARNSDYSGFPPTITFVGDKEPFFWETRSYVEALRAANVDVAYKEYPGCFHAFEMFAADRDIGKDGMGFQLDSYAAFYDKYL